MLSGNGEQGHVLISNKVFLCNTFSRTDTLPLACKSSLFFLGGGGGERYEQQVIKWAAFVVYVYNFTNKFTNKFDLCYIHVHNFCHVK